MKPKLSTKALRKEVLRSLKRPLPPEQESSLHWSLLAQLVKDCDALPSDLLLLLQECKDDSDVIRYLDLQSYADPQKYESALTYHQVSSVLSFLKKFPFGKVAGLDPEAKARTSVFRAEKLCRLTNQRLLWFRSKGYRHKLRWHGLHSIFHAARLMISNWLGPLDLNTIYDFTRHGPGGALGATGRESTSYFKYGANPYTVTARALPYAEAAILADPQWRRYCFDESLTIGDPVPTPAVARESVLSRLKVTNYNKVTFVPKTAQTHRAIAIEPLMNIFLQLGVGDFLTSILRSRGLNLRSQKINQDLARMGSAWTSDPSLCPVTLDLSMASDTLSYELVRELLPEEWFNFLDDIRSPFGLLDNGQELHWAKFSSMGNGFTFQLESLIFFALTLSVARHLGYSRQNIAVYGDDIICPAGMALRLIDVLAYSGFSINVEKSCLFGPFRESCGSDWFEGRYVRPFFLKRRIQNAQDLVFIINSFGGLLHLCFTTSSSPIRSDFRRIRRFALSRSPSTVVNNLLGPQVADLEGHIHAPWDLSQNSRFVLWDRDVQTWSYVSATSQPVLTDGQIGSLYLQFRERRGSGLSERIRNDGYDEWFSALSLSSRLELLTSDPIKLGQVARRKFTKLNLRTLTSIGWRNP